MIGRRWWIPWLWLAPTLALLGIFLVYPSVDTIRRSLLDERSKSFVGLDNYRFIIENPQPLVSDTHSALLNNVLWMTWSRYHRFKTIYINFNGFIIYCIKVCFYSII